MPIIKILAIITLALYALTILLTPLLFGQARKPYSYETWMWSLLGAALIVPLALRVLEII